MRACVYECRTRRKLCELAQYPLFMSLRFNCMAGATTCLIHVVDQRPRLLSRSSDGIASRFRHEPILLRFVLILRRRRVFEGKNLVPVEVRLCSSFPGIDRPFSGREGGDAGVQSECLLRGKFGVPLFLMVHVASFIPPFRFGCPRPFYVKNKGTAKVCRGKVYVRGSQKNKPR